MNNFFDFSISEIIFLWCFASLCIGLFLGRVIHAGYGQ